MRIGSADARREVERGVPSTRAPELRAFAQFGMAVSAGSGSPRRPDFGIRGVRVLRLLGWEGSMHLHLAGD
jgi:hypothetical protein